MVEGGGGSGKAVEACIACPYSLQLSGMYEALHGKVPGSIPKLLKFRIAK